MPVEWFEPQKGNEPDALTISREDFATHISSRIEIGNRLYKINVKDRREYHNLNTEYNLWNEYNKEYLKQSFNNQKNEYLNDYSRQITTVEAFERALSGVSSDFDDDVVYIKTMIDGKLTKLKELTIKAPLMKCNIDSSKSKDIKHLLTNDVFIVHGHDTALQQMVARTVEKLGLKPIILSEQPNRGNTVIEKFEQHSTTSSFAIVLLTPDDEGRSIKSPDLQKRARQNVILELGYFIGKIGRKNVLPLYVSGVELPSDIAGVVYTLVDDAKRWQFDLVRELRAAGYDVDANKILS